MLTWVISMDDMNLFDENLNELSRTGRDRKVYVTNQAISKVNVMNFFTVTEKDSLFIQQCTQRVLYLAKELNDSNEVAITFKLGDDIQSIGIAYGDAHGVNPEADAESYHILNCEETNLDKDFYDCVVVVSHNHPSLSNISLEDIQFFLSHQKLRIMLAVTNRGVCFSLEKLKTYNRREAIKLYNESLKLFKCANTLKGKQDVVKSFLNNVFTCGISYNVR